MNDLGSFKKYISSIDLSQQKLSKKDFKQLAKMENLESLNLSQAQFEGKHLTHLQSLEKLKVLNLFGTSVNVDALLPLSEITTLKKLYLWKSKVTKKDLSLWPNKPNGIEISLGADQSIFKDVRLQAPIINNEFLFFKDSLEIELTTLASNASIRYTINGTKPDSNSTEYVAPFSIFNSSEVKTILYKEDWEPSEIASKSFIKISDWIKSCRLNREPNEAYAGNGSQTLIDQISGSEDFKDEKWLGYHAQNLEVVLELKDIHSVSNVGLRSLEDFGSYIFHPTQIEIFLSEDGKNFSPTAQQAIPLLEGPKNKELKITSIDFKSQTAKYIKLKISNRMKNPEWHSAPGEKCWMFIDEITVS